MQISKEQISTWFQGLQNRICQALEHADQGGTFHEDQWTRPGGGGGRSRVITGQKIEKGGVNFSEVYGTLSDQAGRALGTGAGDFFATGVSIVLHPHNPWVPIIHMNVRYFEMNDQQWWFGGGIDLSPHYIRAEDAVWFHQQLKAVCDPFSPQYYPAFKNWADRYFNIKHRQESRGVGGIFFDRLAEQTPFTKSERWAFVQATGEAFVPIYTHFLNTYANQAYGPEQSRWQALRRGRYTEFNLVWDRGTRFGLETNGRTESILMSMPPMAQWVYDYQPTANSEEANTQKWLQQQAVDWLDLGA